MRRLDRARWSEMSSLLDQLLDADGPQRRLRLQQVGRDDRDLAIELEDLLAQGIAANRHSFLDGSVLAVDVPRAGETVGDYTLERLIGRGGMGSVWLARRSDGCFEREVAIKFPNLTSTGESGRERFHREGVLLASLAHPNIARLLDAGVAGNGQPYLVLEHVQGAPLDEWCAANARDADACIRVFIDVLSAVSYAHDRHILHRDLKPSNILVTTTGQVKLLDFGIAELLGDATEASVEGAGSIGADAPFTLEFAAPEQVQRRRLSTATDVYALGVVLYLLLTGAHPTARRGMSTRERMRAIVEVEPIPLSAAAQLDFPRDLERMVARALSKSPAARYANGARMAADLKSHLDREACSVSC